MAGLWEDFISRFGQCLFPRWPSQGLLLRLNDVNRFDQDVFRRSKDYVFLRVLLSKDSGFIEVSGIDAAGSLDLQDGREFPRTKEHGFGMFSRLSRLRFKILLAFMLFFEKDMLLQVCTQGKKNTVRLGKCSLPRGIMSQGLLLSGLREGLAQAGQSGSISPLMS